MSFDENSNKTKKVPLLSLLFMNVKKTRCPKQCTPGFYQEKSLCFDQQQQNNAVNLDIPSTQMLCMLTVGTTFSVV